VIKFKRGGKGGGIKDGVLLEGEAEERLFIQPCTDRQAGVQWC